jgi:DNA-binding PadR family transcriptional regulator
MRFEQHEHHHHSHHHHRRGGFGRDFGPDFDFGPRGPFGPRGFGGPGGRGPGRRRRGDVRLGLLLVLSEDGARNGYQLIQALSERSQGAWSPSPGSVYPTLSQLEDEGLIRASQSEGESGRSYELTDAGREYVANLGDRKAPWADDADEDNPASGIKRTIVGTVKAAAQVFQDGDPEKIKKTLEILDRARKDIYRVLAEEDAL